MGIVQQASGIASGDTVTVALPAASSAANLVVVIFAGNTTVTTPSGWTPRTSQVNQVGHYLWDRAGGAASYTFTTAAGSSSSGWRSLLPPSRTTRNMPRSVRSRPDSAAPPTPDGPETDQAERIT